MKPKVWWIATLVILCLVPFALAQDQPPKPSDAEKAAMDAMMKAMTPGAQHKLLDGMVGKWDTKVTMWMAPGMPPSTSTASAETSWIFGNRYVEERFSGQFNGMPFSGLGYTGYDNIRKTYWSTWIDNMSTGHMLMTGGTADSGKTWKYSGTNPDPMTGKDMPVETRVTVADADHHTMEMYGPGPDGKMFKMMEIAYTRKK